MRVLNDVIVKMNGGYSMAQVGIVMGSDSDMPVSYTHLTLPTKLEV